MLEKIRTFFGRVRGLHGERRTVVEEGSLWRCSHCHLLFLNKSVGDAHTCLDQRVI